jgi:phage tail protein X
MPYRFERSVALAVTVVAVSLFSGCATWSSGQVSNAKPGVAETKPVKPEAVSLTEGDITDRPYVVLGDVSVAVHKTTVFNADPTRDMVNAKLREDAAKLGADAVIFVRYGTVGISLMSWGSLDGKGRAVQYVR